MSADDEEHSESEFYYTTEDFTLASIDIETTFYLGEYEFMRGELKKIKILFTGMVGPYREIFLRPRAVFKTSRNISLYGPPIR
jgi:lipoprotein NlpI